MAQQEFKPIFLRVPEYCKHARISKSKAYELIKSGEIPSVTIGCSLRIPYAALEKLERRAMSGEEEAAR